MPLAEFTDAFSRGQRALNCSSRSYSPRSAAKIVDIPLKNKISVYKKEEVGQLVLSRKPHRNKTPMMQDRKHKKLKRLKPTFIKVEDRSTNIVFARRKGATMNIFLLPICFEVCTNTCTHFCLCIFNRKSLMKARG